MVYKHVKNLRTTCSRHANFSVCTKMNGSLTLSEYPGDLVRLTCEKCRRAGQYRKAKLVEPYGPDIRLPDLCEEIAQCERARQMHDACRAHFIGLIDR